MIARILTFPTPTTAQTPKRLPYAPCSKRSHYWAERNGNRTECEKEVRAVVASIWGALRVQGYDLLAAQVINIPNTPASHSLGPIFYLLPEDPAEKLLDFPGGTVDEAIRAIAALPRLEPLVGPGKHIPFLA